MCAGDEVLATRFALASGSNTWARPHGRHPRRHHRHERLDPTTGRARWTVQVKGEQDIVGQTGERLILLGTGGTHRTMTLLNASPAVRTTVRLSKAQPEGSTPVLLRGALRHPPLPGWHLRPTGPGRRRPLRPVRHPFGEDRDHHVEACRCVEGAKPWAGSRLFRG
ncbi:hypothetical protein [Streptomyces sp. NPDC055013]